LLFLRSARVRDALRMQGCRDVHQDITPGGPGIYWDLRFTRGWVGGAVWAGRLLIESQELIRV
jgi:hypothetical protein